MKDFFYGILFMVVIYPLLSGAVTVIEQLFEYLCVCIAVKAAKKQTELPQQAQQEEPIDTQVIGFQIPSNLEEECEEEE